MGFFDRAKSAIAVLRKQSAGIPLSDIRVGEVGIFGGGGKRVSAAKAVEQYKGWVYTALHPVAEDVAKINWHLMKVKNDGTEEEIFDHELLDLLHAVNPHMTKFELLFSATVHLRLAGNSYWLMDGVPDTDTGKNSKPTALYPLNPKFIKVKRSKGLPEFIEAYEYEAGTTKRVFKPHQILHHRDPDPNDPYEGIGVVQAIPEWVDAENMASQYNRAFFENSARPDAVLEAESGYSETQMNVIKRSFEDKYRGPGKAHKTLMLPHGVTYKAMQQTQKEMDFVETQRENRDKILAAFGVPRTRIGLTDDVNRANAEATIFAFAEHTVKPLMALMTDYLNEFLVPRYGDDLFLTFDSPVPEDREAERDDRKAALAGQAYKSINEAREDEGLPPIENGDEVRGNPVQNTPIGAPEEQPRTRSANEGRTKKGNRNGKPSTRAGKTRKKRDAMAGELARKTTELLKDRQISATFKLKEHGITALTDDEYDAVHKQFIGRVTEKEEAIRRQVVEMHADQQKEVVKNLREIESKAVNPNDLMNKGEWTEVMVKFATPVMLALFEEEGAAAAALLGFDDIGIMTEETRDAIEGTTRKFAEKYNDTTAAALAQAITKGQEEGLSLPQLEKEVASFYEFSDSTRAARVARTETFRVANTATKEAWRKTGVVKTIKWFTAADERVESMCRPLHGKTISIEENFFNIGETVEGDNGKTMTVDYADVGAPPLHVNCRCYTRPDEIDV